MLHPALHVLATRPLWLAEHAEAYSDLAAAELADAATQARWAVTRAAVGLCALGVAATLAGVALMLWAVLPSLPPATAWALWAAPGAPLAVALLVWALQLRAARVSCFSVLRQQWQADLALLRGAAAP
ncbi:MAG: hypothetical protein KA141_12680 [Rubrivivax sp.]|nr:hypothetical protein [Rubrivivax sp.]